LGKLKAIIGRDLKKKRSGARRARPSTRAREKAYGIRAGVAATNSRLKRRFGLGGLKGQWSEGGQARGHA
jgi:hypothetical protein